MTGSTASLGATILAGVILLSKALVWADDLAACWHSHQRHVTLGCQELCSN